MSTESSLEKLVAAPTVEVVTKEELASLFDAKKRPKTYVGFEISGKVHLGTGLICMKKVKDMQDAGLDSTILLADWHTWINRKLGGDFDLIKVVAGGYFKEALSLCIKIVGGDPAKTRFVLGSDVYDNEYWKEVIEVCKSLNLKRVQRMLDIMGRKEGEAVDFAQLLYPPMQIADIFHLGIDVPMGGMDQRKAHMGARDVAADLRKDKPIALHTHMLLGLQKPPVWPLPEGSDLHEFRIACKMSKSVPNSAIFVHDSPEEIREKVQKAFCPEKNADFNPVVEFAGQIIFPIRGVLKIERAAKFGGDIEMRDIEELKQLYSRGKIHPLDLKSGVANSLVDILKPARSFFEGHRELVEIFNRENTKVTR